MTVYVASMKMRGTWAPKPDNTLTINVTSMQSTTSQFRADFSPMSPIKGLYKGFYCFESYWQAYKCFDYLGHLTNPEKRLEFIQWWKDLDTGKRRHPLCKKPPVHAIYDDGIVRGYIDARKNIYVPQYYDLMINTESFKKCKKLVESGNNVVIYDFDGPRNNDGSNTCLEVNLEMLKNKINDVKFPFGHGYVVAAALMGYKPTDYCL
jgi:hypothetical protein